MPSVAEGYNKVQLVNVLVDSVLLTNHQDTQPLPSGSAILWHLDTTAAYRVTSPTELRIRLSGSVAYDADSPKPFDLAVALVGIYKSEDPFKDEEVPLLFQSHSYPLLWPYLREIVADLSTRAGGPTLILPTLHINIPLQKASLKKAPAKKAQAPQLSAAQDEAPVSQALARQEGTSTE
jgi:preprotein translocase subunit SecB